MENVLWRCRNLPSCPNLQNAVIMCGTNNIQPNSVEDIVDGIVEKAAYIIQSLYLSGVSSLVIVAGQLIEFI